MMNPTASVFVPGVASKRVSKGATTNDALKKVCNTAQEDEAGMGAGDELFALLQSASATLVKSGKAPSSAGAKSQAKQMGGRNSKQGSPTLGGKPDPTASKGRSPSGSSAKKTEQTKPKEYALPAPKDGSKGKAERNSKLAGNTKPALEQNDAAPKPRENAASKSKENAAPKSKENAASKSAGPALSKEQQDTPSKGQQTPPEPKGMPPKDKAKPPQPVGKPASSSQTPPLTPKEAKHGSRNGNLNNDKGDCKQRNNNKGNNNNGGKNNKGGKNHKGGKGKKKDEEGGVPFNPQKSVINQDDEWWLYYDQPQGTSNMSQENFEDSMNLLGTFNNMAQFWERFGDMGFENLPTLASLRTFKRGVTPSWEHPANENGGKWIVVVPKLMSVGVFNEVLAAVISGKVAHVNGVLLAKKRREDLVNVWTSAAPEHKLEAVKAAIVDRLAKCLSIEADISFKKHGSKKAQKTAKGAGCDPADCPDYEPDEELEEEKGTRAAASVESSAKPSKKAKAKKGKSKTEIQTFAAPADNNLVAVGTALAVLIMGLILAYLSGMLSKK